MANISSENNDSETREEDFYEELYWLEIAASIVGLVLNAFLSYTVKISEKGLCQRRPITAGLCFGRFNLWISQLIVCIISILTCALHISQIIQDQSKIWWNSFLNSIAVIIFCCNVLTGQCLMDWTQW